MFFTLQSEILRIWVVREVAYLIAGCTGVNGSKNGVRRHGRDRQAIIFNLITSYNLYIYTTMYLLKLDLFWINGENGKEREYKFI